MDTVVMHWLTVGLMAATFILVLKFLVMRFIKFPGLVDLVGSI
jgi:hypothetical protein